LRRILNVTWKDEVRNEVVREKMGQVMLETTLGKTQLCWLGHMEESPKSKTGASLGSCRKKKPKSEETLNRWTWRGMMSDSKVVERADCPMR